ncbi:MAG: DUF2849 domain-containing protein [Pseudomonadota bacterium]
MPRSFQPSILTTQSLLDGDVLWWTGRAWSREIARAQVIEDAEEAARLEALASGPAHAAETVGAYLVEVSVADGAPYPTVRREQIRAEESPTFAYRPEPLSEAA